MSDMEVKRTFVPNLLTRDRARQIAAVLTARPTASATDNADMPKNFYFSRNSANTLTKRSGLRLILPSRRSCYGGHRHQKLVSATNRAENRTRASVRSLLSR